MVRTALVVMVMSLGLGRELGCSNADTLSGALNAPCTRSKDCGGSLVCSQGVCSTDDAGVAPEGGPDAALEDAADDGG